MHKYKKNEQKFIFRLVFSVFGLRGVAVASVFPRISLICTDLLCYPCSSVRSLGMEKVLLNPFLSAFFLETTSLPLRYQSISIQYFPRALLPISRRSFAEYPPPLHPTLYTLHPIPFTFPLKNLHIRKFCCTFAARNPTKGCLRF